MSETTGADLITDRTLIIVFASVFISSGIGPLVRLLGHGHPLVNIVAALIGASLAMCEAREVQKRIKEAELLGTGFVPGFFG